MLGSLRQGFVSASRELGGRGLDGSWANVCHVGHGLLWKMKMVKKFERYKCKCCKLRERNLKVSFEREEIVRECLEEVSTVSFYTRARQLKQTRVGGSWVSCWSSSWRHVACQSVSHWHVCAQALLQSYFPVRTFFCSLRLASLISCTLPEGNK